MKARRALTIGVVFVIGLFARGIAQGRIEWHPSVGGIVLLVSLVAVLYFGAAFIDRRRERRGSH